MCLHWSELPLGRVLTLQRGFDLPKRKRVPGNIPIVSSAGISGSHNEAKVLKPGIVTGRYGTIGKVYFINEDFFPLNTTLYVKDFKGNDPLFLAFLLQTIDYQSCVDKSSVPGVNRNDLHLLKVNLPPLPEQKAIAHILGTLDDKIELNNKMNQTLEAIAQTIFKSWFVNFDPVRAKMDGQQPVGMDAATAELFPDSFEDSELGKIPKGWEVSTIGESVKVVGGSTPSTKNPIYWEGGNIHWVSPKVLSTINSPVLLDTERKITELGLQQISSGLLPKGTLLLSSRAPIGYLAISEIPVAINQGFIAMVCNQKLSNYYVLQWANENMSVIYSRANGSTFLEISKSNFRPIEIVIPHQKILDLFTNKAEVIHNKIVNNLRQSQTLSTLRDTLLPKLMSGEIRVAEAEKQVENVL